MTTNEFDGTQVGADGNRYPVGDDRLDDAPPESGLAGRVAALEAGAAGVSFDDVPRTQINVGLAVADGTGPDADFTLQDVVGAAFSISDDGHSIVSEVDQEALIDFYVIAFGAGSDGGRFGVHVGGSFTDPIEDSIGYMSDVRTAVGAGKQMRIKFSRQMVLHAGDSVNVQLELTGHGSNYTQVELYGTIRQVRAFAVE